MRLEIRPTREFEANTLTFNAMHEQRKICSFAGALSLSIADHFYEIGNSQIEETSSVPMPRGEAEAAVSLWLISMETATA